MLHLVYVPGESIATPFALTNELALRLSRRYDVLVHRWDAIHQIKPARGDILLGHPFPVRGRVFDRSFDQPGWARRFVLCPFAHADPAYIAYLDRFVCESDGYLAVCGEYWTDTIEASLFAHWRPKLTRLDLGVNTDHFPRIKDRFNPPGERKILYIGRLGLNKGTDLLARLSTRLPNLAFGHLGSGAVGGRFVEHGARDLGLDSSRDLISRYDFIVAPGRSDANPTTVLEAIAWGLVPIVSPRAGYFGKDWLVKFPVDHMDEAAAELVRLNECEESELLELQRNGARAVSDYSWDRFAETIIGVLESTEPSPVIPVRPELARLARRYERRVKLDDFRSRARGWPGRIGSGLTRRVRAAFRGAGS